jgi:opacity protein-like surface antigen
LRRFEILGEGILGGATHPGGRMLGATLLFRFDFKPWGRAVPFVDVGSGPLNTTVNRRAPELSGRWQFMSQGGGGIQYFFRPQRAVVFEYRYVHLSNADLLPPNFGFNASVLTVGFRWLRRPRPSLAGR